MSVMQDLAYTVKVGSDQSENLTEVFDGAMNGNLKICKRHKVYNFSKFFYKIIIIVI